MTNALIVGGGIAGLTAATLLGRAGKSVVVLEQAEHLGGRAATQTTPDGFHFNIGPHALYLGGKASRVLRELDIRIDVRKVGTSGAFAVCDNRVHPFPSGLISMAGTRLFNITERLEALRFLARLGRIDPRPLDGTTVTSWLERDVRSFRVRLFVQALIRVSSYTNAPLQMSAGAALEQLQLVFRTGVAYVSGGWQTLVDRLRERAAAAGANLRVANRVQALEYRSGQVRGVRLDDGTRLHGEAVVLAVPPGIAMTLLGDGAGLRLRQWIENATPVQAACLDLGLHRLPQSGRTFALGLDAPLYLSVHSRWAELAPKGAALVHVAKYLPAGLTTDPAEDRTELERYMDLVQPSWRDQVIHQRFLPRMNVTQAIVRSEFGGLKGRPGVDAPAVENVYLAGDWVGPEGMLVDAAFASASRAAKLLIGSRHSMLQAQAV